jgi:hypothetical protein
MKRYILIVGLLVLAACAPAEQTYCDRYGIAPGHPEYEACLGYYFNQEATFKADRQICEIEADATYPPTLYDRGHWNRVYGGIGYGPWGYRGGGFGTTVFVEPDFQHNRQVDALRMRIIQPCMEKRGWNSGASWQAGRKAGGFRPSAPKPVPDGKLPWLK